MMHSIFLNNSVAHVQIMVYQLTTMVQNDAWMYITITVSVD